MKKIIKIETGKSGDGIEFAKIVANDKLSLPAPSLKEIVDAHTGKLFNNYKKALQSLPAQQPEPEGKHVCCGRIKNPDTGQYQKEPHDLCGWSCQPTWEPSQPESKTLEVLQSLLDKQQALNKETEHFSVKESTANKMYCLRTVMDMINEPQ